MPIISATGCKSSKRIAARSFTRPARPARPPTSSSRFSNPARPTFRLPRQRNRCIPHRPASPRSRMTDEAGFTPPRSNHHGTGTHRVQQTQNLQDQHALSRSAAGCLRHPAFDPLKGRSATPHRAARGRQVRHRGGTAALVFLEGGEGEDGRSRRAALRHHGGRRRRRGHRSLVVGECRAPRCRSDARIRDLRAAYQGGSHGGRHRRHLRHDQDAGQPASRTRQSVAEDQGCLPRRGNRRRDGAPSDDGVCARSSANGCGCSTTRTSMRRAAGS